MPDPIADPAFHCSVDRVAPNRMIVGARCNMPGDHDHHGVYKLIGDAWRKIE